MKTIKTISLSTALAVAFLSAGAFAGANQKAPQLTFNANVTPVYDFDHADVILSLDADFLSSDGAHNIHYMRQFASRRRVESRFRR